jgi:hypothetical protein
MCLPTSPKYLWSITRPLLIDDPNSILYADLFWPLPLVDLLQNRFEHIRMMLMLTRSYPDDADVDTNSSEGVDPSSSEGVDRMFSKGVDRMSSEGVDPMLTQNAAKLLSALVPNVPC